MTVDLEHDITTLIEKYGLAAIKRTIIAHEIPEPAIDYCTIVVSEGVHFFPDSILKGEVFVFHKGMLDLSSQESILSELYPRLINLKSFLLQRNWRKIYLVVSGHSLICMITKLAIFRICHMESIDFIFDGNGKYTEVDFSIRSVLSGEDISLPRSSDAPEN